MEKQSADARVRYRQVDACNRCKDIKFTKGQTGWHPCSCLNDCQVGAERRPVQTQPIGTCKPVRIPRSQTNRALRKIPQSNDNNVCVSVISTTMDVVHPFWQTPVPVPPGISPLFSNSRPYWSTVCSVSLEVPTRGGQAVPAKCLGLRTVLIEIREFPVHAETSQNHWQTYHNSK